MKLIGCKYIRSQSAAQIYFKICSSFFSVENYFYKMCDEQMPEWKNIELKFDLFAEKRLLISG
jgi:hypothetical protein